MSKTRKIEESFFQLLQIAVGKTLFDTIDLSDEEWRAIYELATKQSLVSVILHAIDTIENDDQSNILYKNVHNRIHKVYHMPYPKFYLYIP